MRSLIATIHIQQGVILMDGRLPLDTFITLTSLLFPDELKEQAFVENSMVAPDGYAIKLEIELSNGKLKKPFPDVRSIPKQIPWFIEDIRHEWRSMSQSVELKVYNIVRA